MNVNRSENSLNPASLSRTASPPPAPVPPVQTPAAKTDLAAFDWLGFQGAPSGGQAASNVVIADVQPPFAPNSLVRADLNLNVTDRDGIESKSARDITGTLNGKVVMDRDLISKALREAEAQTGLNFSLSDNPRDQNYKINVSYTAALLGDVPLANLTIRPSGNGLRVDVGGLAGGVAEAADWVGKKLGYDPQAAVDQMIRENLGGNLGLKVESSSITQYQLAPDLKKNPLLQEIPLSAQTRFKVESLSFPAEQGNGFRIDSQGNLELNFKGAQVVGSTASGTAAAVTDKEGSDVLNLKVQGQLLPDFSSTVNGQANLSVKVMPEEKQALKARLKEFTGQDMAVGGNFDLSGTRFSAQINSEGKITKMEQTPGQLSFQNLSLDSNGVSLNLQTENGVLTGAVKDKKYQLQTQDLGLKGSINTPQGKLQVQQLDVSGTLTVDPAAPQKLDFAIPNGENVAFSGQFTPTGQKTPVKVQNLALGPSRFQLDASQGSLSVAAQDGVSPKVTLASLAMPEGRINNLKLTGSLQANLNSGALALQASSFSLGGKMGNLELTRLSGAGNLHWDNRSGLEIKNANISAKGKVGDLEFTQIKGSGDIAVTPTGQVRFSSSKDLQIQTGFGLGLKGNLNLDYTPGQVNVSTTSKSPVLVDYVDPSQGIDLKQVAFSGRMNYNETSGALHFSSHPGKALELKSGSISGVDLKNINLRNGQVEIQTPGGAFTVQPLAGQNLTLSGTLSGLELKNLTSAGPIQFDPARQSVNWDQPLSGALPAQGIEKLSTEGPVEISQDAQGKLHFRSNGGTFNLKMGKLELSNFKIEGEAVLDASSGQWSFNGLQGSESPLKLSGQLNGYPVQAESSGQLRMLPTAEGGVEISGEKVKLNSLIDGFTLQSPEGASGKVVVRPDGGIDLKELNFDVTLDDVQLQNRNGLFKTTPEGFEINLSGDINLKQEQLMKFLQKFSARPELGAQAQAGIQKTLGQLNTHFAHFNQADIHYENMKVRFDRDFNFQGFEVVKDTRLENAEMALKFGKTPQNVNVGTVHWRAEAEADATTFRVKDGDLEFGLTPKLREVLDQALTRELSAAGFKDVELEIAPGGAVSLKNATYEVRAKGRSGNKGTEIEIPLLSRLLKKPRKLTHVSAQLDLKPRVENNQLVVELDDLKMKGLIAQLVNKIVDGEDKLSDQIETQLKAEQIKYTRKDGESVFRIDLNDLLQKQIDPGIRLTEAQLTPEGQVKIGYTYQQTKP